MMVSMDTPGRGAGSDAPGSQETWSLKERGSFTHGVCRVCGWVGPGRRAPHSAGVDAELHTETAHPATPVAEVQPTPVAESRPAPVPEAQRAR